MAAIGPPSAPPKIAERGGLPVAGPLIDVSSEPLPSAIGPGQWDEVRRAVDASLAAFGHIDVLVNALGDSRAVGPHMLQRRSGKVINIASWTPHQGGRDMVLYTTAKTALADLPGRRCSNGRPMACMSMPSPPAFFPMS